MTKIHSCITALFLFFLGQQAVHASEANEFCILSIEDVEPTENDEDIDIFAMGIYSSSMKKESKFTCKQKQAISSTVTGTAIGFQLVGLMCLKAGVTGGVGIFLSGVGLGLQTVNFAVQHIPCEDDDLDEKIDQKVCEAFEEKFDIPCEVRE